MTVNIATRPVKLKRGETRTPVHATTATSVLQTIRAPAAFAAAPRVIATTVTHVQRIPATPALVAFTPTIRPRAVMVMLVLRTTRALEAYARGVPRPTVTTVTYVPTILVSQLPDACIPIISPRAVMVMLALRTIPARAARA